MFTTQKKIRKAKSTISASSKNGERECLKWKKGLDGMQGDPRRWWQSGWRGYETSPISGEPGPYEEGPKGEAYEGPCWQPWNLPENHCVGKSSPLVLVPKKDGSLRLCLNFRKLTTVCKFDPYPMPRIDEQVERIGRARYISTLDLCKGYWQVPLEKKSRENTAFRTPIGLLQFTTMAFGLYGATATFQWLMDHTVQDCEDCCAS